MRRASATKQGRSTLVGARRRRRLRVVVAADLAGRARFRDVAESEGARREFGDALAGHALRRAGIVVAAAPRRSASPPSAPRSRAASRGLQAGGAATVVEAVAERHHDARLPAAERVGEPVERGRGVPGRHQPAALGGRRCPSRDAGRRRRAGRPRARPARRTGRAAGARRRDGAAPAVTRCASSAADLHCGAMFLRCTAGHIGLLAAVASATSASVSASSASSSASVRTLSRPISSSTGTASGETRSSADMADAARHAAEHAGEAAEIGQAAGGIGARRAQQDVVGLVPAQHVVDQVGVDGDLAAVCSAPGWLRSTRPAITATLRKVRRSMRALRHPGFEIVAQHVLLEQRGDVGRARSRTRCR